jgi:RNA-directed DNA polymerase
MQGSGCVKERPMQERPTKVPGEIGTTQGGEPTRKALRRARWKWAQAQVWTDRMLAALEYGVQGEVWFSLIDKVYDPRNLLASWRKSAANKGSPGVDGITIERFEREAQANLARLSEQLRAGSYQPKAIRRTFIPKVDGSMRPLGIPTVSDRIVQGAIRHVIEPIFEREFAIHSYGFRPVKGCRDALRRVDELLKGGYRYVVDADLKSYFDTIPHDQLMARVRERIADGRVLKLMESFLKTKIMEGLKEWTPMAGAPQGAVLSPLLSNIYLNPLDHQMARQGYQMVRYADDFVILCESKEQAERALAEVQAWVGQAGLTLHPEKTRIVDAQTDKFEFLGFRFDKGRRWPRDKSKAKLRATVRERTRRTSGVSLSTIVEGLNRVLRGWFGYFKHADKEAMREVDGWVRMRLRSVLRKREKRRGVGRGWDHRRWPNRFFAAAGLFSLEQAHRVACQSMKVAH